MAGENGNKNFEITDHDVLKFNGIINDNLKYIESKCFSLINSRGYFTGKYSDPENEALELFNLVITKLRKDNYKVVRAFKGSSKFSTYLSGIISFTYVDYIRKKRGRKSGKDVKKGKKIIPSIIGGAVRKGYLSVVDKDVVIPDEDNNPEIRSMKSEREDALKKALKMVSDKLTGEEKLLLKMRFLSVNEAGPVPVKKISEILGISEKAVYKRINKVLTRCRSVLESNGISSEDIFWEKK